MKETNTTTCQRCGAHITRTFRVGDFVFGSECINKVDTSLLERLYGTRLDLADAVQRWAARILKSRAKGAPRNLEIDIATIPQIGTEIANSNGYTVTVVGYTDKGVRVRGFSGQYGQFYNDIPFNGIGKYQVVS